MKNGAELAWCRRRWYWRANAEGAILPRSVRQNRNFKCRMSKLQEALLAADKQLTFSIKDEDNKGNFVLGGIKALAGLEGRRYEG